MFFFFTAYLNEFPTYPLIIHFLLSFLHCFEIYRKTIRVRSLTSTASVYRLDCRTVIAKSLSLKHKLNMQLCSLMKGLHQECDFNVSI